LSQRYDHNRIRETVTWVEGQPKKAVDTRRGKPRGKVGTVGITTGSISAGSSGTITEQYWTGSAWSNTGVTLTVYNYFGSTIATSTKVIAIFVNGALHVIAVDCA
jgi:hypothetical protein